MKRRKVDFQKLVNSSNHYSLDVQLNVFQWMLETGWEFSRWQGPWEHKGVFEMLYNHSGNDPRGKPSDPRPSSDRHGFDTAWISDKLQLAFVRAIVDTSVYPVVQEWRDKERIALGNYRMLPMEDTFRIHANPHLLNLFGYVGKNLAVQFNEVWPDATLIKKIVLTPDNSGWQVMLGYGSPGDSSRWTKYLLPERTKSVACAVADATKRLEELCEVKNEKEN